MLLNLIQLRRLHRMQMDSYVLPAATDHDFKVIAKGGHNLKNNLQLVCTLRHELPSESRIWIYAQNLVIIRELQRKLQSEPAVRCLNLTSFCQVSLMDAKSVDLRRHLLARDLSSFQRVEELRFRYSFIYMCLDVVLNRNQCQPRLHRVGLRTE